MATCAAAKQIWRKASCVCFDVDSTLLIDEAIDELAKFCGVGKEVEEWTTRAMGGGISFREALNARLSIIKPSRQNVSDYINAHPPQFSPGIRDLVSRLHDRGTSVYLVSGGFQREYAGFDEEQPTSMSGGKKTVAEKLKNYYGYKTLVAIGDGATDMEAFPPADTFIGYGGNVVRQKVKDNAPWFVTDIQELINELENQCSDE
ncbi:hypothetical protein KUTeg_020493 [Tegillarca granosa]|uniref:Phosphoserine phosphatase n=1 Tax=Tegillarca granosa TaxID=220873 RepID=A0ABQ9E828_TEGGR|nr:hypothetical protein KUTeg_020493 [Tegillarca granosa]